MTGPRVQTCLACDGVGLCDVCLGCGELVDCAECQEPFPRSECEREGMFCGACRRELDREERAA